MNRRRIHISLIMLLWACASIMAQTLNKPDPEFNFACASATFNTFKINFTWSAPLVKNDNQFILEMSDPNGSFATPLVLSTVTDKNTTLDFDFTFTAPTTMYGKNYKFRVRSTNPALTSPETDAYEMFYKNVNTSLVINNLVGSIEVCDGTPATINIDNFPGEPAYRWFRNGTLMTGESGNSLTTATAGTYYVEVDYGDNCSSATLSNAVTVVVGTSSGLAINGDANVDLCSTDSYILEANVNNNTFTYTWYKDGVPVTAGVDGDYTYTVDGSTAGFDGAYTVGIAHASICNEISDPVNITAKGAFDLTLNDPKNITLIPGTTRDISITTNAQTPEIKWFKDNVEISGATTNTLTISEPGTYKVSVKQTADCETTQEIDDIVVVAPTDFLVEIKNDATYTACVSTSTELSVDKIYAVTSNGNVDVTADFLNKMAYQWYRNDVVISGASSSSYNVADFNASDAYHLIATYQTYSATSDKVTVSLVFADNVVISAPITMVCNGGDNITLSSDVTNTDFTYEWYRNNQKLSETTASLATNLIGTYKLIVSYKGCEKTSNDLVITEVDNSAVQLSENSPILLVEGTPKNISATGGNSYMWYDANDNLLSDTDTVTLTQEGNYRLVAEVGSCQAILQFSATYKENFNIPNVITPNSDGVNDLWVLPNTYAYKDNISITIYNSLGKEVFTTTNYQNNWPESTTAFTVKNIIYYYKVREGDKTVKQGTLTIIK